MHLWNLVRAIIDRMENKQHSNEEMLKIIALVVLAWEQAMEADD